MEIVKLLLFLSFFVLCLFVSEELIQRRACVAMNYFFLFDGTEGSFRASNRSMQSFRWNASSVISSQQLYINYDLILSLSLFFFNRERLSARIHSPCKQVIIFINIYFSLYIITVFLNRVSLVEE